MKKLACNRESLTFLPQMRAEHLLACLLNAVMIFEYFFALERKCNLSFSKLANAESVSGLIKRNIAKLGYLSGKLSNATLLHEYFGNCDMENFAFLSPHPSQVLTI